MYLGPVTSALEQFRKLYRVNSANRTGQSSCTVGKGLVLNLGIDTRDDRRVPLNSRAVLGFFPGLGHACAWPQPDLAVQTCATTWSCVSLRALTILDVLWAALPKVSPDLTAG